MKNKKVFIALALLIIILLALCPWVTKDIAEAKVSSAFHQKWDGVVDGCGFNCSGCGIKEPRKSLFGYQVGIEYACGIARVLPENHETKTVFVSFLLTVHNL